MPSRIFKKQFKIPMQAVIKRHMNGTSKSGAFKLFDRQSRSNLGNVHTNTLPNNSKIDTEALGLNPSNISVPSVKEMKQSNNVAGKFSGNSGVNTFKNRQSNIKYKYTVIQKVVDMNNKLLGFTIKDLATNQTKNLSPQELSAVCKDRLVDNVMLVRKDNGQAYLKGNGIRLESLPSVIL